MVDLSNPFATRTYDPTTNTLSAPGGESQPPADAPAHVFDGEYAWDNLTGQERAIWASVFGVAYVRVTVEGGSAPYAQARVLACKAISDHRQHGA